MIDDALIPPNSIEAEQALIGAGLFDNEAFHIADDLESKHFYEPVHGRMWEHITDRLAKGLIAEPSSLTQRFAADPAFVALGGLRYVADLLDRAPPPFTAKTHATTIRDAYMRRELVRACGDATEEALAGSRPAIDILQAAESAIFALGETGAQSGFAPFADALHQAMETAEAALRADGAMTGLATGLVDLDAKLGGLHPSDLVILAGRPSMGKTALATNVAHNAARAGAKVGFFSLEMSKAQLASRLVSEVSGVPSDAVRRGDIKPDEYGRLRDAAHDIRTLPLEIDDTGGLAISKLSARARRLKRTKGLDLLVIDYLQLVTAPETKGQGRVQEVSAITQALKALAKELHIPVLALSQLSRQVEQRDDKRPQLSDLRESGSIEQDADVVMFVYRESYYLGRAEPKLGSPQHLQWEEDMMRCEGRAEVIVGKQRHGPIGTVHLAFNDSLTKFGNLAREGSYAEAFGTPSARYSAMEPS